MAYVHNEAANTRVIIKKMNLYCIYVHNSYKLLAVQFSIEFKFQIYQKSEENKFTETQTYYISLNLSFNSRQNKSDVPKANSTPMEMEKYRFLSSTKTKIHLLFCYKFKYIFVYSPMTNKRKEKQFWWKICRRQSYRA